MSDRLELKWVTRPRVELPNGGYKSERRFLDFVVNSESLYEKFGRQRDLVTILCKDFSASETVVAIDRLLLSEPADLPGGRRLLLICAECGGLECGALTGLIEREGETISWRSLAFQTTDPSSASFDGYNSLGPFRFDSAIYEQTLRSAITALLAK